MTTTTFSSPSTRQIQPRGATMIEVLCVLLLVGLIVAIVVPSVLKTNVNQDLMDSKAMILNLFKIAQYSAIVDNGPLDIKQKVRLLIHIDSDYKGYCKSMMLIQGERGHWKILQPPMDLHPGIFFVLPSESFLYTMSFDAQKAADGQGPMWIYYEFDSKGKYAGSLNRVCIREGKLEERNGKPYVTYAKNKEAACIYVNPTGVSCDVKK